MRTFTAIAISALVSLSLSSCALIFKGDKVAEEEFKISEEDSKSQKSVVELLLDSPRHHQWVSLSHGDREFQAFVVYPETKEKTKAVIVIHENRGLDDWARLFTDKLAAEGFLVIAPDFISNTREGKKRTSDFENPDAARDAIYDLDPAQVTADLDAAYKYLQDDASSTGEIAILGFCWGGSQTFRYATHNMNITSAHVFYGTAPEDAAALARISAPVYGYYGGDDNRVNATIEKTESIMNSLQKTFEYEIYDGAGHAFMKRAHGQDAEQANITAHDTSWERLLNLLQLSN